MLYLSSLLMAAAMALTSGLPRMQAQAGAPAEDLCASRSETRRARRCEVREELIAGQTALDIDPGRNGSVRITGRDRTDTRLRARVEAYAESEPRAAALVNAVRVTAVGGRVRSDGPMTLDNEHWATSFYLDVPRNMQLAINTQNGGISIEEFNGAVVMRAMNGGITLRRVGGDLKGQTRNGGLHIELAGERWQGNGLDVETTNGGVRLTLPANYSAELETGTVHGRVDIGFPVLIHSGRQRRFTTTLGSGGPKIRAMTTNGSVVVGQK